MFHIKNASLSNHLPTWGNSEYSSTLRLFRSLKFSVQKESANHAKTLKDVHVRVNCIQTFVISHSYHTHIYHYISNYNIRLTIIYMSKWQNSSQKQKNKLYTDIVLYSTNMVDSSNNHTNSIVFLRDCLGGHFRCSFGFVRGYKISVVQAGHDRWELQLCHRRTLCEKRWLV